MATGARTVHGGKRELISRSHNKMMATPASAILAAVIFNALVIVALIPLALRGVRYRPTTASALLRRNLRLIPAIA